MTICGGNITSRTPSSSHGLHFKLADCPLLGGGVGVHRLRPLTLTLSGISENRRGPNIPFCVVS